MAEPTLQIVTRTQGNNAALKDGTVKPPGFQPDFREVSPLISAFRRMVRGLEFDICEMAFTTYLCARAHGKAMTALPIFLVRGFHHGALVRHAASDVRDPANLEGRRVGVNRGYTVTTGVWARGILSDEYGVDLNRVTWVLSGDEHVAEYRLPANVVPVEQGESLEDQLVAGRLAAAIGVDHPDTRPLLADPTELAFEELRRNGLYPINHLVVVRDELLEDRPELARDIFAAFTEAKKLYLDRLRAGTIDNPTVTDEQYARVLEILDDPLPYGIEPNRIMIERLIRHAVNQRILDHSPRMESLFAAATRDLIG